MVKNVLNSKPKDFNFQTTFACERLKIWQLQNHISDYLLQNVNNLNLKNSELYILIFLFSTL